MLKKQKLQVKAHCRNLFPMILHGYQESIGTSGKNIQNYPQFTIHRCFKTWGLVNIIFANAWA